jgi:hypothetical protein
VPGDLANTAAWPTPDTSCLNEDELARFERMQRGIRLGLKGGSASAAAREARCSRPVLERQLNRCLTLDATGAVIGWAALISRTRVATYRRKRPVQPDQPGGAAGAFAAFLGLHPAIEAALQDAILDREQGQPAGTKRSRRKVFRAFLTACKKNAVSDTDYPLNTQSKGRRSVYRYVEDYLASEPSKIGPWYGEDAAKRTRLGSGKTAFVFAMQPLDEAGADAHHTDCIGIIEVWGPAGPQRLPVKRLWIYAFVDEVSKAVLGYAYSTGDQPSGACLEEAIACATRPWAPRQLCIQAEGVAYLPGAGLPYGTVAGLPPCRPALLKLDNAAQHYGLRVGAARRQLGCVVEMGEVGAWWHNAVTERLFETLEQYGFHFVPSSMGTGPADPCRRDPVAKAVKNCILQEELIDLLDVLFANLNATPSRGLGNQSSLQVIANHLNSRRAPWLPRRAPPTTAFTPRLGVVVYRPTVRGALKTGRTPYVEFANGEYSSPELSGRCDLIGHKIVAHVDARDGRTAEAYELSGRLIGTLKVRRGWALTRHSLELRKAICALRNAGELIIDEAADPVQAYCRYLADKARSERRASRQTISPAASRLHWACEQAGLSPTDFAVPTQPASNAPSYEAPRLGLPCPIWSTLRR